MKRREFLGALDGTVIVWPLSAHAQQPTERMRGRMLVVGLIVLLCLMGLGFIGPGAIAQDVVSQYRWRRGRAGLRTSSGSSAVSGSIRS